VKPGSITDYIWDLERLIQDRLKQLHSVLAAIGGESSHHLKNYAPQTPPINCFSVPLFLDHFWCQILRSSADGHRLLVLVNQSFGKAEISQLDIA